MVNLSKLGKRILFAAAEESEEFISNMIRGWLVGKLKNSSVEDLQYAVEHNMDLWLESSEADKKFGFNIAKRANKLFMKYKDKIDTDLVLEWLSVDREDLWIYIMLDETGEARRWLDGMIDKVKMRIWEKNTLEPDIVIEHGEESG